jgi:FKBP-type peptidyl-prolyl cis-trans isomerase FkpA
MRRRNPALTAAAPLLVLLALGPAGCGDARPAGDEARQPAGAPAGDLDTSEATREYAPHLEIDLDQMRRTDSGLFIQDLQEGTGTEATAGDLIVVHYTGWLANGEQFDSSRPVDRPFEVVIGTGEVIQGWDQGIPGMRVGGTRRLVIPPALGYGAAGAGMGIIPPGATLIFEVELLEVRR